MTSLRSWRAVYDICMYVCMYVRQQRAALDPLWCPQPTLRFEGYKGDICVRRTEQAGELF